MVKIESRVWGKETRAIEIRNVGYNFVRKKRKLSEIGKMVEISWVVIWVKLNGKVRNMGVVGEGWKILSKYAKYT